MTGVRVTAEVRAPVAGLGTLMIDALLDAMRYGGLGGPLPYASAEARGHLVPLASAGMMPGPVQQMTATVAKRTAVEDVEMLNRPRRSNAGPRRDQVKQTAAVSTRRLVWLLWADPDAVRRLLAPVSHLGRWRAHGWGRVACWRVEADDLLAPAETLHAHGAARRVLPAEWIDGAEPVPVPVPIRKPYWWRAGYGPGVDAQTPCRLDPTLMISPREIEPPPLPRGAEPVPS